MLKKKTIALLVTTYIGFILSAHAETPAPVFTAEQEARIGKLAGEYLLQHPEVLVQVSQRLQHIQKEKEQMQFALKVMEHQKALISDPDTPTAGPENADVAVIQFFDYQCIFCSQLAPVMETVMKANPDARYIFKEWPIFASRWENSEVAALTGVAIWKEKGADAYLRYHNGIFHTGHNEGHLTGDDIKTASDSLSYGTDKASLYKAALKRNDSLAQSLGLTGTPGLIVMPVKNAMPGNITVFPGLASAEQLLAAIEKAKQ